MNEMYLLTLVKLVPHSGLTDPKNPAPQLVKLKDQQYTPEPFNIELQPIQVEALMSVVNQVASKMHEAQQAAGLKQAMGGNGKATKEGE